MRLTITLDAQIALYDVEVTSSRGRRRGVGTELFAVVEKTNNGGQREGDVVTVGQTFLAFSTTDSIPPPTTLPALRARPRYEE